MSRHSKYGSHHGPRNPFYDYDTDYGTARTGPQGPRQNFYQGYGDAERGRRPRFIDRETGYGTDYRDPEHEPRFDQGHEARRGREEMQYPNQDIRGAGFNDSRNHDRNYDRYERDEYYQTRGGLPGFNSSPRHGSGYIYNDESTRSSGVDHTGRGPKGWKRSDERIREDVSECLERHAGIDASEIEVSVKDGVVTLTGSVDHRRSKRLVEDALDHLSGIKDIKNDLNVNQSLFNQAREILTGENVPNEKPTTGKSRH